MGRETGCQGYCLDAEGWTGVSRIDSSSAASVGSGLNSGSFSSSKTELDEAIPMGAEVCVGAGWKFVGNGALKSEVVVLEPAGTAAGRVGSVKDGTLPAFCPSVLRSRPRATRNVPLDCSTLIGLVSTRFAPIRNALATPLCPSTTATASEVWLEPELRALLNSRAAFCSFSQSTTTASKCSAINFLTAAKVSLQGST